MLALKFSKGRIYAAKSIPKIISFSYYTVIQYSTVVETFLGCSKVIKSLVSHTITKKLIVIIIYSWRMLNILGHQAILRG